MTTNTYMAFYPSRPFWAGEAPDIQPATGASQFFALMATEVVAVEDERFSLRVDRDGRIRISVSELDSQLGGLGKEGPSDPVRHWGNYLAYLNTFYLLLDAATLEVQGFAYFNLHEVTSRDAFKVSFEAGRISHEAVPMESVAHTYVMGRYLSEYQGRDVRMDLRFLQRQVITEHSIRRAAELFAEVIGCQGSQRSIATFAKGLAEYKNGNYQTSVVLSWFTIEEGLNALWRSFLETKNTDLGDGRMRINSKRKQILTSSDYSASVVTSQLELNDVISHELFRNVDRCRGLRNDVVHRTIQELTADEAQFVLRTAKDMIKRRWSIDFFPNLSYFVGDI